MMTPMMFAVATYVTIGIYLAGFAMKIVGQWKLLEKMHEKGWKALIPIYGEYLAFKHVWSSKMFFICHGSTLVAVMIMDSLNALNQMLSVPVAAGCFVLLAAGFVMELMYFYKLAKSFGHGGFYVVGLVVAKPLFTLGLGFSKNRFAVA